MFEKGGKLDQLRAERGNLLKEWNQIKAEREYSCPDLSDVCARAKESYRLWLDKS